MTDFITELSQAAPYLDELRGKINTLQFIGKHLQSTSITIEVTFKEGDKILIDQQLIPFNLEMELRLLIGESIDEYQRALQNMIYASGA